MLGMTFKAAQGGFFDRDKVIRAMDRKSRKVLSKFGAFVRQRARTSIRKRKRPSTPGTPPSSHTGLLRKGILFAYDDQRKSVVIGPAKFSDKSGQALPALEYGGTSLIETIVKGKRERREVVIRARPFMTPAFIYEQQNSLPGMWADIPFK